MQDAKMSMEMLLKVCERGPEFLDECDAALENGTLAIQDARLVSVYWAFVTRIQERMNEFASRHSNNQAMKEFLNALPTLVSYSCDANVDSQTACDFTKLDSRYLMRITLNGDKTFVCDRQFHDSYLSRVVEYALFMRRCAAFPFKDADEALQVFTENESVLFQASP